MACPARSVRRGAPQHAVLHLMAPRAPCLPRLRRYRAMRSGLRPPLRRSTPDVNGQRRGPDAQSAGPLLGLGGADPQLRIRAIAHAQRGRGQQPRHDPGIGKPNARELNGVVTHREPRRRPALATNDDHIERACLYGTMGRIQEAEPCGRSMRRRRRGGYDHAGCGGESAIHATFPYLRRYPMFSVISSLKRGHMPTMMASVFLMRPSAYANASSTA